jgi:hypothetical protein
MTAIRFVHIAPHVFELEWKGDVTWRLSCSRQSGFYAFETVPGTRGYSRFLADAVADLYLATLSEWEPDDEPSM